VEEIGLPGEWLAVPSSQNEEWVEVVDEEKAFEGDATLPWSRSAGKLNTDRVSTSATLF
jgi:hypothetical protein